MGEHTGNAFTSAPASLMAKRMPTHASSRHSAGRILLVEDEEAQRLFYEQELSEEGYLILWAKNGKEALKRLEESHVDLVVLDILMPEMDGIEVLGKMAARYKKMPIILHSAYPHYQDDFMTWLADAFVVKSSDLSGLKKTVKGLLMKNSEEKEDQGVLAQERSEILRENAIDNQRETEKIQKTEGNTTCRK
jgi:DNA-binding NtrC family response regulator